MMALKGSSLKFFTICSVSFWPTCLQVMRYFARTYVFVIDRALCRVQDFKIFLVNHLILKLFVGDQ